MVGNGANKKVATDFEKIIQDGKPDPQCLSPFRRMLTSRVLQVAIARRTKR
jgi:hypothetical protein